MKKLTVKQMEQVNLKVLIAMKQVVHVNKKQLTAINQIGKQEINDSDTDIICKLELTNSNYRCII